MSTRNSGTRSAIRRRVCDLVAISAVAATTAGCTLDQLDSLCPDIPDAALVITEIRAEQDDADDSIGEFIELFNSSDQDIPMTGVRLEMIPTNGRERRVIVVRNEDAIALAGDYFVIGQQDDSSLPDYIDYGFRVTSGTPGFFPAARIIVAACDQPQDELIYTDLPDFGTLSLDPTIEPSPKANDDDDAFCRDETIVDDGTASGNSPPGTPGEGNRPCTTP